MTVEVDASHAVSLRKLDGSTMVCIGEYFRSHPDVHVTAEGFAATFRARDASSLRAPGSHHPGRCSLQLPFEEFT